MQGFTRDLFDGVSSDRSHEQLAPGAWLLHGFALERGAALGRGNRRHQRMTAPSVTW